MKSDNFSFIGKIKFHQNFDLYGPSVQVDLRNPNSCFNSMFFCL